MSQPYKPQTRTTDAVIDDELVRFSQLGGAAGLTFARVVAAADQTVNNSTTLVDDNELLLTLNINTTYFGLIFLIQDSGSVPDFKHAFSLPAGATGIWLNNAQLFRHSTQTLGDITTTISSAGISANGMVVTPFRIIMGATAGNSIFQFAQNTLELSDTIRREGSFIIVWEEV